MGGYIARRILWALFVLLAISFITFVMFSVLPSSDPVVLRAGRNATPEVRDAVRHALGLDRPWYAQYWIQLKALVGHFDFGRDYFNGTSVRAELLDRLPATLGLVFGATIVWLGVGIPLGILAAVRHGRASDRAGMGSALLFMSAPPYWLGLLALFLFANDIGTVPIFEGAGTYPASGNLFTDPVAVAPTLFLPWLVLAASLAGIYARFMRASLIDVLGEDYIRTARAKGVRERDVIWRHGVRAAITPVVTILGVDLGVLLGGAILIETVFAIPGIGDLSYTAIKSGNLPLDPGHGADRGAVHRHPQRARRHRLRVPRSAGALPMSLLEVRDLRVGFAGDEGVAAAVDGVSFSVAAGGALGIVGESGCGKSVTALSVMGLLHGVGTARVSGTARFDGVDLLAAGAEELRALRGGRIAMVFQDPLSSLHPLKRSAAQVVEAIAVHRSGSRAAARARVVELLGLVGIPEPARRFDSYPHELSGGMRQRVMIAMALANEPALLIADEPTTALDVTVQAQILELLARLRAELGMALVLITHDVGVVAQVADEVAVMYAGRIVEHAPTGALFAAPQHPYTWGLLGAIPRLDRPRGRDLVPIDGRPPSPSARPPGCAFAPRCPYARPSHSRIDPALEGSAAAGGHAVACLLPAPVRGALWAALSEGADPPAARAAAGVDELPEPVAP